jgi:hypothetical protein
MSALDACPDGRHTQRPPVRMEYLPILWMWDEGAGRGLARAGTGTEQQAQAVFRPHLRPRRDRVDLATVVYNTTIP